MGGVAGLDVRAERPALDGLGQDHRGLAGRLGGRLVRRVQLAVVVTAPGQVAQVVVGEMLDQPAEARVGAEEVLADVGAVLGGVLLEFAVNGGVHLVEQHTIDVTGQQLIPLGSPHHLDHVPAGAPEGGLELLDDLAVAPDGAVEALQVAVDHEDQVVELLAGGQGQGPQGLGLVAFTVTEEAPHPALAGVGDTPVVEVPVDVGLVDGVERGQAHRHGGELPEVRHEPRVGIRRQAAGPLVPAGGRLLAGQLQAEVVQLRLAQPAVEVGPGVDPRRGVALEVHLVARLPVGLAPEEVVEPHLIEAGGAGEGRQVAANALGPVVGPHHHDGGIPADERPDAPLDVLVTGKPRLLVGGIVLTYGVDTVAGKPT